MTVFASFEKRNESGSNTNMSDFKVSVIYKLKKIIFSKFA